MEQEEENIEVGKTYNVRMLVARTYLSSTGRMCLRACTVDKQGHHLATHILSEGEADAFSPINPYQPIEIFKMTEIPEPAPKYDPCRKFREGDEVRYVPCNGRECPVMPCDEYYREKTLTVVKDEDSNHQVLVRTQDGREKYIRFCYLQLITPVEELKPYYIDEYPNTCKLMKRDGGKLYKLADYWDTHPRFKAAAEAERDRLNEEWRKEQHNG